MSGVRAAGLLALGFAAGVGCRLRSRGAGPPAPPPRGFGTPQVLRVDFNGPWRDADLLVASRRRNPEVGEGEDVWLEDAEGSGCPGVVAAVEERVLLVQPDAADWWDPGDPRYPWEPPAAGDTP